MSAEGLLAAIRESPHDDTHRLVYADWLEDHGQADRAEFIRVQLRLAALGEYDDERDDLEVRERELLARHEKAWVGELPPEVCGWQFRRGFVDELTMPARAFVRDWRMMFARHPLTNVRFVDGDDDFPAADLAVCPGLERLSGLRLRDCNLDEMDRGVKALLQSPLLHNLRRLDLAENGMCYVAGEYLANNPALTGLEELDFSGGGLDEPDSENALACFTGSKVLTSLKRLRMHGSRNEPDVLLGLNESVFGNELELLDLWGSTRYEYDDIISDLDLPRLRSISLHGATLGPTGGSSLLGAPGLLSLKSLDLSYSLYPSRESPDGTAMMRALLRAGGFSRLESLALRAAELTGLPDDVVTTPTNMRRLDLSNNPLGGSGLHRLASLPWLPSVTHLALVSIGLGADALRLLAESPGIRNLRVLALGNNPVTTQGVEALTRSPHLTRLKRLELNRRRDTDTSPSFNGFSPEIFGDLPRLTELNLAGRTVSPEFVQQLGSCRWLEQITWLDLSQNRDIGPALCSLAESPYLSPLCKLFVHGTGVGGATHDALRERLGWRLIG